MVRLISGARLRVSNVNVKIQLLPDVIWRGPAAPPCVLGELLSAAFNVNGQEGSMDQYRER